jgi:hypothetical protein
MTPPAPPCRLGWLAAVLFCFAGCGATPSEPENQTISNDYKDIVPWIAAETVAQPRGYRPVSELVGDFMGTLEVETPTGGSLRVEVEARARRPDPLAKDWDLFFFDATRTLSPTGVIALQGGAGSWLSNVSETHVLRLGLISLSEGVLGTPGASVYRHDRTFDLRGEMWLRMPTPGADLAPMRVRFWLKPVAAAPSACEPDADIGVCSTKRDCDVRSGFCLEEGTRYQPGFFSGNAELISYHKGLSDWSFGPQLPDDVPFSAIWCAGTQVELSGQWTSGSMGADVSPFLSMSGDVACMDPRRPGLRVSSRGPVPLVDRVPQGAVDGQMLELCLKELARKPSDKLSYQSGGMDFRSFREGFLDYDAGCISLGHFAALYEASRYRAYDDGQDSSGVHARKIVQRLLQQWLQVHRFLLIGASTRPQALQILEQMKAGWAFVIGAVGHSGIDFLLDVQVPDYRRDLKFGFCGETGSCVDPSLRCQRPEEACTVEAGDTVCTARRCVLDQAHRYIGQEQPDGAVPLLLETLALHLELAERTVDAPALGETLRMALLVESIASRLYQRAAVEEPPVWTSTYSKAVDRYRSARTRAWTTLGLVEPGTARKFEVELSDAL